jgi:hypothetical protein
MTAWLIVLLRISVLAGIGALMLVPTGMCICTDCAEESLTQQHEPGCPKVRKLDRPAAPHVYEVDRTVTQAVTPPEICRPAAPPRTVEAVAHGPPRGQPIYLTLQTLLI